MPNKETHQDGKLILEIHYKPNQVIVKWLGESKEREPVKFINPVFDGIYSKDPKNPILLDFTHLEYMNSSTVTPIVKIIEHAKKENRKIQIQYKKGLKWQELSFTALKVFAVPGLVEVISV
jgi:hypothetical protein